MSIVNSKHTEWKLIHTVIIPNDPDMYQSIQLYREITMYKYIVYSGYANSFIGCQAPLIAELKKRFLYD